MKGVGVRSVGRRAGVCVCVTERALLWWSLCVVPKEPSPTTSPSPSFVSILSTITNMTGALAGTGLSQPTSLKLLMLSLRAILLCSFGGNLEFYRPLQSV